MDLKEKQQGFSLIELSIVLTIISFLIAAIVAGHNVKKKFELNQIMEDIGAINNAVNEFRAKYNGYPGDLFDAEDRFGAANTNSGSGDNVISNSATGQNGGSPMTVNEQLLFWQHLSLAGYITSTYDGVTDSYEGRKRTPIAGGVFGVDKQSGGNLYLIAELSGNNGLFSTKQSWQLDNKFDDGDPDAGNIQAIDSPNETAGDCVSSGEYNLGNDEENPCIMHFFIEQTS